MIQRAGRMVLEGMRMRPSATIGPARKFGDRTGMASRSRGYPGPARLGTGRAVLAAVGAALAAAGALLYLRKRRQVAAHYRMGAGETAREAGTAGAASEAAGTAAS